MADRAEGTTTIEATPAEVMAVISDFEAYPEWNRELRTVNIVERDSRRRPIEVAFGFSGGGFDAEYTLVYEYAPRNRGVSWTTKSASGAVRDVEGEYELEALPGATEVTYRLAVDLNIPLPGFVKRQAQKQILKAGLEGLKRRVESS